MWKKWGRSAAALLAGSVLLAGCGSRDTEKEAVKDVDFSDEELTLELWLTPQFMGVFSPDEEDADYDSFFKEAAKRYNEEHPNVNIEVSVIPGDDRESRLSVAAQTDTLPDIFFDSHFVLSQWAHEGLITPLDDIIDTESREDIPEAIWDNVTINDEVYMYPFNHNLGTLAYNADLFKEAGLEEYLGEKNEYKQWTLEEYEHILKTLSEELPEGSSPMGLFALNEQGDTWNLNWLRMYGNPFWGEDGEVVINEESGVKALDKLAEWHDKGYTNSGPESVSSNDVNASFQNQKIAIGFGNTIIFNNMLSDMENGELEEFDARMALNPQVDDEEIAFTYVLSSIVYNTGTDKEIAAAQDFVKFYSSDSELVMASAQGVPVRDSVSEQLSEADDPFLEANQKVTENVYDFSNNTPGYTQLRNILFPELQAVLTGEKDAQKALDSYTEQANDIIEKERKKSAVFN